MARPKNVKQKRNEQKYWLPDGVVLIDTASDYNKESKLLFNDLEFGNFYSSFKALQAANASTHKLAVKKRRENTNLQKYGTLNPGANAEVRKKAKETMLKKYGVPHALNNEFFLNKSKETLQKNYNVSSPMHSLDIKEKQKETVLNKYGVSNVMKNEEVKQNLKNTFLQKFGVDNPSKNPKIIEKILQTNLNNKTFGTSIGEKNLKDFIENQLGLKCSSGFIGGNKPKQLDIIVEGKNIAIEYNGSYWHSEANPNMYKNYHLEKKLSCDKKNIKLIQIFDFEWENRKTQVQSFLRSCLNVNSIYLNARSCELIELNKKEANLFLDNWHILGKTKFIKAFGLKFNNEIQAVITIGKHHRTNSEYVLSRYCGKQNVTVRGGLSKLVKHALKEFKSLTTWIDLRYSNGQSWINNGWEIVHTLPPDYFYYDTKTNKVIKKQSRKKSLVKTPDNMTEHEHAINDGLVRVYDCGKLKLKIS